MKVKVIKFSSKRYPIPLNDEEIVEKLNSLGKELDPGSEDEYYCSCIQRHRTAPMRMNVETDKFYLEILYAREITHPTMLYGRGFVKLQDGRVIEDSFATEASNIDEFCEVMQGIVTFQQDEDDYHIASIDPWDDKDDYRELFYHFNTGTLKTIIPCLK